MEQLTQILDVRLMKRSLLLSIMVILIGAFLIFMFEGHRKIRLKQSKTASGGHSQPWLQVDLAIFTTHCRVVEGY